MALDVVEIAAVTTEPRLEPNWARTLSGESVLLTPVERLAEVVGRQLHGSGTYDPDRHYELSCLLHTGRVSAEQRATALSILAVGLAPERWLVAPGARPPDVRWPVDVLAIGPTGIYVCEVAGTDLRRAASDATSAARALALNGRGLGAQVIPVVLCEPSVRPHQLELADGQRVWALPIDTASAHLREADRAGVRGRCLRRMRRPAPGWEYRISATNGGLVYEVCYDPRTHRRHSSGRSVRGS